MAMVCPECRGRFDQHLNCPNCGVRLEISFGAGKIPSGSTALWRDNPIGRLVVGLTLAQGAALGLRFGLEAGTAARHDVWSALGELVLIQAVHILGVLFGGVIVGANQKGGMALGAFLGLVNSLLLTAVQLGSNQPVSPLLLYGQPIVHVCFGAAGGWIGARIWQPLPTIPISGGSLAPRKRKSGVRQLSGRVAWPRVIVGAAIASAGVLCAQAVLDWVIWHADGQIEITSHLQSRLVTWEIAGLAVLAGSGLAGANSFNGMKQGLFVAVLSTAVACGYLAAAGRAHDLQQCLQLAVFVTGLGLAGGWIGCKMFPPVAARRRHLAMLP